MRPKDVIRVYVKKDRAEDFAILLEWCAKHKKSYHLVSEADLERLTDTKHHDGICMVAKERRPLREGDLFRELGGGRNLVLFLDGVGNPHNLGAILRTAAHFGVKYVAGAADELPRISPSANRTSEGGAEHVSLVRVEDTERFFDRLKSMGFQIYGFDPGEKAVPLFDTRLAEKAVFVMGAEVSGLSGLVRELSDVRVKIPGTGVIESLNVSVAAALAMAEFQRQAAPGRSVRIVKTKP
jgi:TrmH RNA methyltransferase